jgi:predicted nucleic acid-binding protein
MILADTSIVIACQRTPTARLLKIIQDHDAAICGVTEAEVYAGARSAAEFARCAAVLSAFQRVTIPDTIWLPLGQNLFALRTSGTTVPFMDALIATVAIAQGLELWTYDAHFQQIQGVLTQLRLFQEPP